MKTSLTFGFAIAGWVVAGIIYVARSHASLEADVVGPVAQNKADAAQLAALKLENQRLRDALRASAEKRVAHETSKSTTGGGVTADPKDESSGLAKLNLLADLQKRKVLNAGVAPITRDGKLSPAFAELFELTSAEQAALQEVVDHTRSRMADLQAAAATVSRNEAGAVVVTIPSLVESPQIYDETMDGFARTLGPARNSAFVALGENQMTGALDNFGAEQKTLTVTKSANPKDPSQPFYDLNTQTRTPHASSSSSSRLNDLNSLNQRVGPLARLIPPDL
jgi:preprotein translocase subunit SecD